LPLTQAETVSSQPPDPSAGQTMTDDHDNPAEADQRLERNSAPMVAGGGVTSDPAASQLPAIRPSSKSFTIRGDEPTTVTVEAQTLDDPTSLIELSEDDSIFGTVSFSDPPEAGTVADAALATGTEWGVDSTGSSEGAAALSASGALPSPSDDAAESAPDPLKPEEPSPSEPTPPRARKNAPTIADPLAEIVAAEILPLFPELPDDEVSPRSRPSSSRRTKKLVLTLVLACTAVCALIGAAAWWYLHHN
jgi:hypothetical protein